MTDSAKAQAGFHAARHARLDSAQVWLEPAVEKLDRAAI
jgi:hypothetical protein